MKLRAIAANQTIVTDNNGNEIFFSYNTPVAGFVDRQFVRTEKKWSVTTTRHINKYLNGVAAEVKPQSFFDELN